MKLYSFHPSGNCYKLRLLMNQLAIPYELVDIDILSNETRTPEFLAKNPNGKVPLLELSDGRILAESNAMLWYLAEGTPMMPADAWTRAQILQWMFFEQYSHEPYIAVVRFLVKHRDPASYASILAEKKDRGYKALDVMETHLHSRDFFVDNKYSLADIALFAYTHVAHEGDFDLSLYPAIESWIERIQKQAGFVSIDYRPA